jgi:hypothetical protein
MLSQQVICRSNTILAAFPLLGDKNARWGELLTGGVLTEFL